MAVGPFVNDPRGVCVGRWTRRRPAGLVVGLGGVVSGRGGGSVVSLTRGGSSKCCQLRQEFGHVDVGRGGSCGGRGSCQGLVLALATAREVLPGTVELGSSLPPTAVVRARRTGLEAVGAQRPPTTQVLVAAFDPALSLASA